MLELTATPAGRLIENADLNVFLGTNSDEENYENSRAGFTRETDDLLLLGGRGATHGRVLSWYDGTTNLSVTKSPDELYRRLGDGYHKHLYDSDFPGVPNPWYTPDHKDATFQLGDENAPWEGIGTGWFYSVLGGGKDLRPESNLEERVSVSFDNTAEARMRGDFGVPTLFNGNFDAVSNPNGLLRNAVSDAVPGWSFHGGTASNISVPTDNLVDWKDINSLREPRIIIDEDNSGNPIEESYFQRLNIDPDSPNYQTNYALELNPGQSITHNRFIVPEWGDLRLDLHAPDAEEFVPQESELYNRLKVFLIASEIEPSETQPREYELSSRIIVKGPNENSPRRSERLAGVEIAIDDSPLIEDHQGNRIAFGQAGFETFNFDIPDELRGKPATVRFELEARGKDDSVYLDNIFFQSNHLLFGNPTESRILFDPNLNEIENDNNNNRYRQNYLVEKPQYAISYNDTTKNPNWVSWQLNKSWLADLGRTNRFDTDHTLPSQWDTVKGNGDINNNDIDNRNTDGNRYDRGHMIPSGDRTRDPKDNFATYLMSNILPQNPENNQQPQGFEPIWSSNSWWKGLEFFSRLLAQEDRELYIIAGGSGTRAQILSEDDFEINVPERLWKVVLVLDEAGLGITDVTANTMAFALDIPNINPVEDEEIEPNSWRDYVISVQELENRLEEQPSDNSYDFLSNIPTEIQEIIENRPIGEIRAWIETFSPNA